MGAKHTGKAELLSILMYTPLRFLASKHALIFLRSGHCIRMILARKKLAKASNLKWFGVNVNPVNLSFLFCRENKVDKEDIFYVSARN